MASIKKFEEFVSEMDRAEEIEQEVIDKGTPEVKSEEEAEEEAEEVQGVDESFYRLPKDVIATELYVANQSMQSLYSGAATGNDISPKEIDFIIKNLQQAKSLIKKFNKAEEVIGTVYEAGEAILDDEKDKIKEETKPVADLLKECYEAVIKEAKAWEEDAHDEHTVETYMAENASLVASMSANCVKEMKEDMASEAYEACLNKMSEAFTKKINECKESTVATDAEDINQ